MSARCAAIGLFLVWMLAGSAAATIIQFHFGVHADSGPLAGTSASGTFSIDDSVVPFGAGNVWFANSSGPLVPLAGGSVIPFTAGQNVLLGGGLLTQLDFTWDGIQYLILPLVNQIELIFRDGQLQAVLFGFGETGPPPTVPTGNCGASAGVVMWCVFVSGLEPGSFSYSNADGIGGGPASARGLVPEPSTLSLLGTGALILLLAFARPAKAAAVCQLRA